MHKEQDEIDLETKISRFFPNLIITTYASPLT